jgi:hypothetical protein
MIAPTEMLESAPARRPVAVHGLTKKWFNDDTQCLDRI